MDRKVRQRLVTGDSRFHFNHGLREYLEKTGIKLRDGNTQEHHPATPMPPGPVTGGPRCVGVDARLYVELGAAGPVVLESVPQIAGKVENPGLPCGGGASFAPVRPSRSCSLLPLDRQKRYFHSSHSAVASTPSGRPSEEDRSGPPPKSPGRNTPTAIWSIDAEST